MRAAFYCWPLFFSSCSVRGNTGSLMAGISLFQVTVTLVITFCLFFINGYIIAFMASHHYKTSISLMDVALLPLMMHLWSFIIPFRGGLLFSAFFLKMKYNIKGAESIAIGVFTTMISLVITGLCGVYFTFYNDRAVFVLDRVVHSAYPEPSHHPYAGQDAAAHPAKKPISIGQVKDIYRFRDGPFKEAADGL